MAPKNNAKGGDKKSAAKGKGKDAGEDSGGKGKGKGGLKAASSINVRHILVRFFAPNQLDVLAVQTNLIPAQCEKHSKKEEALEKLRNGAKFDEVARDFSEDKARQGMLFDLVGFP